MLFKMADEAKTAAPGDWTGFEITDEAIEAKVNARLQAEYEEAQQILDMMPSGRGAAEFLGGMVGITADVKNLPFMFFGGGSGSLVRVMGREAAINMAAEAAFMPSQFSMAERLDIPDPDVVSQLAMAAAAGGILGGAVEGARRGYVYWRGRNQTAVPGMTDIRAQAMVDEVEDIITSDTSQPFGQIERLMDEAEAEPPYILENPLNPTREPLLLTDPLEDLPDGISEEERFAYEREMEEGKAAEVARAQQQIDDIPVSSARKPLSTRLKQSGRPNKTDPNRHLGLGKESMQVHPDGFAAAELRHRGITHKSSPGLFSRKGRKDFDNLVASEWEEDFPGISAAAGISDDGMYLDRDGFLDVLARDINGDDSWLVYRQQADSDQAKLDKWADRSALDDYYDMEPEGRYFVDIEAHKANNPETYQADIEAGFYEWMRDNEFADILTEAEIREIVGVLQERGGDPEYLIERALEREVDHVEGRTADQPSGQPARAAGQGDAEPGPDAGEAGGRGAGGEGDRAPERASERTAAGDQTLIDGVAPVSDRDRLEARQNAPMRGGNAAADEGLFDTGARLQSDLFSDPSDPKTKDYRETVSTYMREEIAEEGDIGVDVGDGKGSRSASAVLDELDADDDFLEIMNWCGRKRETE
ncbi:hypothetical protein [Primorskyibacter flagellatus]|nr:hypothetical protein [Primorskyibacter flagellatus]